jgi:hypothetical protein
MKRLFHKYHSEEERYLPHDKLAPKMTQCPYCKNHLATAINWASLTLQEDMTLEYRFCLRCGWWDINTSSDHGVFGPRSMEGYHYAILDQFQDDDKVDLATTMLANEMALNPDRIWDISPRKFEELITSVFSNVLDCNVELTKTTRDGGKDIIGLDTKDGKFVVETKRYREDRKIGVSIVRNLLGVMCIEDVHTGFIVSTSRFTSDAEMLKRRINSMGAWHLEYRDLDDIIEWLNLSFEKYFDMDVFDQIVSDIVARGDNMGFPREFKTRDGRIVALE